jgi:hypothetical protein
MSTIADVMRACEPKAFRRARREASDRATRVPPEADADADADEEEEEEEEEMWDETRSYRASQASAHLSHNSGSSNSYT